MKMETVKTINGISIKRYEGTHKPYFVNVQNKDGVGFEGFYSFPSAKKAELFVVCITSK